MALEERIEAELVLGEHAQLVGELEALVREHPLREASLLSCCWPYTVRGAKPRRWRPTSKRVFGSRTSWG